ncbi:MAG: HutD family protein [Sneathiellales bacterium]|nr:HutD family protein [Sneathiellales bacterium]
MKNQFFERDSLSPVLWKNGGGITREIATSKDGDPFWRLSIADVTAEGAFSVFPGLQRILTVVEGKGMILLGDEETIHARPLTPLSFSGSLPVTGKLVEGPVQNFNLIYDAAKLDAEVRVLPFEERSEHKKRKPVFVASYCVKGAVRATDVNLQENQGCYGTHETDFEIGSGSILIKISLFGRSFQASQF